MAICRGRRFGPTTIRRRLCLAVPEDWILSNPVMVGVLGNVQGTTQRMMLTLFVLIGSAARKWHKLREVLPVLRLKDHGQVPGVTLLHIMVTLRDLDIAPSLLDQSGRRGPGQAPLDAREFQRTQQM
jgi:hypothetical protein